MATGPEWTANGSVAVAGQQLLKSEARVAVEVEPSFGIEAAAECTEILLVADVVVVVGLEQLAVAVEHKGFVLVARAAECPGYPGQPCRQQELAERTSVAVVVEAAVPVESFVVEELAVDHRMRKLHSPEGSIAVVVAAVAVVVAVAAAVEAELLH